VVATDRRCGPCTLCCKVMEITELNKPRGVWCPHRKADVGCSIHGHHPASCQGFQCQWILDPALPFKLRPDQTKVVLTSDEGGRRLVANCDPANPLAWRRDPIYAHLKGKARATWSSGHRVIAKAGKHLWLIAPDQDIDVGEIDDRVPFQIQEGPDGVRVIVLPPIAEGESLDAALEKLRDERLGPRAPS
jgi:hypothetical protein